MGDCPTRQLILHTRILVGWFSWELNPEVLGSSWLKASATWGGGGSLRLKASVKGRWAVPTGLKPKLVQITFKDSDRTAKKTPHFTVTKINRLTVFKEIIAVYSKSHKKHKYKMNSC
jgi:hypothetical protein